MGDKVRAKEAAARGGRAGRASRSASRRRAPRDAYPLLVKAAAGGGGRGMRVVESPDGLDEAIAAAQREAQAGFGDDRVFIERFLPRARHIEVQVIGDTHGTVLSLGERECSLQRRHQKVLEESPSPVVAPELRAAAGRGGDRAGARGRLLRRRHGRVHRRRRRPVDALLPRDERAPAGRAPGHRAGHRPRPRRAAAARRRGRGASTTSSRPDRPRDRGAHQRRGRELLPVRRPGAAGPLPGRRARRRRDRDRQRSSAPTTTR